MTKPLPPTKKPSVKAKKPCGGYNGERKLAAVERERLFIAAFLANGRKGSEAAIAAGFAPSAAKRQAVRMLKREAVRKAVEAKTDAMVQKLEISAERNLLERARMAYCDIGAIAKANIKRPADIAKLPEDLRRCITGWKWDANKNFVIQFADKAPHLTALDKHLGLYDKDNRQKGEGVVRAVQEFFESIYGERNKLPIASDR